MAGVFLLKEVSIVEGGLKREKASRVIMFRHSPRQVALIIQ